MGVDHGNGWVSTYYHLINEQRGLVGQTVAAGTRLGDAGRTDPCRAGATFDHVHFGIQRDGARYPADGLSIGGYTAHSTGRDYYGYWTRNSDGARVLTNNGGAVCCLPSTTSVGGGGGGGTSTDLYFVKTRNTGSGRVEAFTATASSGYQSGISSATRFSPGDANNGWFGLLPSTDLYFVKTKNTGSGRVEVHTATAGSNFQSGVSTTSRFSPGDSDNGWFGLLPNRDLYFVKTKNTGSGKVEVHTATAASGYTSGISTAAPRFSPADANNGWFGLLPNNDLYFVKTKNTGSGRVEAFTATAASGYRSGVSSATRFSPADADNGWFRMLPNNDVYFVKTKNTGSGKVEVHTVTSASSYQAGISSAAPRFSSADANNGWFGLLG